MAEPLADCDFRVSFESSISYGTDIRRPGELITRKTGDLLAGVRDGEWQAVVSRVRELPLDSGEQRRAKAGLPYTLWGGEFSRRDSRHLLRHSGIVGIDLDALAAPETRRVMHTALDDPHCLAAYRSASGLGVRLLVRVQPTDAEHHKIAFDAAANYVRAHYAVEPDVSGSDVSRASFVSWDGQILINAQAATLPITLPPVNTTVLDRCVHSRRLRLVPWWIWLAREFLPFRRKPDGTFFTHGTLLRLGLRLALRATRESQWLTEDQVAQASEAWFQELKRRGMRISRTETEYHAELVASFESAWRTNGFRHAADFWTRWTRDPEFPCEPKKRICYAVRRHCEATGHEEFFLSCRDAAAIAGVGHVRAAQLLRELCANGFVRRVDKRRLARQAITYHLLKD